MQFALYTEIYCFNKHIDFRWETRKKVHGGPVLYIDASGDRQGIDSFSVLASIIISSVLQTDGFPPPILRNHFQLWSLPIFSMAIALVRHPCNVASSAIWKSQSSMCTCLPYALHGHNELPSSCLYRRPQCITPRTWPLPDTHMPWCMPGSLLRCGGENVPAFPTHAQPALLCIS